LKFQNPCATLLLVFINDVANGNHNYTRFDQEMMVKRERMVKKFWSGSKSPLLAAALSKGEPGPTEDIAAPEIVRIRDAIDTIVTWYDFKVSLKQLLESDTGSEQPAIIIMLAPGLPGIGLSIKGKHTIVPPWPYLRSENMTREGVAAILAGGRCGSARYVEIGW
jgi:hypothetical protein